MFAPRPAHVLSLGSVFGACLLAAGLSTAAPPGKGNGAPSGAHYTLNIIGVPKAKTADMSGNNGRQ